MAHMLIKYQGEYKYIHEFLKEKFTDCELKQTAKKELMMYAEDASIKDEIGFFRLMIIDDKTDSQILEIKDVTETEYNAIAPYVEKLLEKKTTILESTIRPTLNETLTTSGFVMMDKVNEKMKEVNEVLVNAVLPTKIPIRKNDPFSYLLSPAYLSQFFVASTVVLVVFSIFG